MRFATRLPPDVLKRGFDIKSLSEILGHANVNITLNRYVHSSMEQKSTWTGCASVLDMGKRTAIIIRRKAAEGMEMN